MVPEHVALEAIGDSRAVPLAEWEAEDFLQILVDLQGVQSVEGKREEGEVRAKPGAEKGALGRIGQNARGNRRGQQGRPRRRRPTWRQAVQRPVEPALSKKPVDTGTGDLFASPPLPDLPQEYKAALESEGITHPKAQTAAAMADLGASAQDAFDFFSATPEKKPLTKPKPKRICRRRAHLFQGVQKPERVSRAMAQHAAG
jgi:hypothetical protein